jgi:DNA-binding response OmpR family regulator
MKNNQTLPLGDPAVRDCAPLQSPMSPPHHILVVEDDVGIRQLNTAVLLRCGYAVDIAEDGAAAWEALNAESYDLMITDNKMPKVSGVELLKMLRAARMELPVIMATGSLPTQEFARYPWLRPAATLVKPYTIGQLLRTVKRVLRKAGGIADAPWQSPANSPRRILAVDEDHDLRLLYTEALTRPDFSVDVAEDGAAGWEALQANTYHLLITEHDLPKLTGVDLVRKLRASHMGLPVVMAVGRLPTHELARTPSLQLAATLVKPFAVDALLDTVENVLRATDRRREQIAEPTTWQSEPLAVGWQL